MSYGGALPGNLGEFMLSLNVYDIVVSKSKCKFFVDIDLVGFDVWCDSFMSNGLATTTGMPFSVRVWYVSICMFAVDSQTAV